jgi:formate hydrogenlyase subunit 6/NADH:ubiquinone oxidoreductase subunit I
MGLIDIIKRGAFVDILRGMSVTGGYLVGPKVTVEYPWEKVNPYPRFRGVHALLTDPRRARPNASPACSARPSARRGASTSPVR